MSLTAAEEKQITNLEDQVILLTRLIKGSGSLNQLNRLLVLGQNTNKKLEEKVELLEAEMTDLIALARRLQ